MKIYSLKKCKQILRQAHHLFQKKKKQGKLSEKELASVKTLLLSLQTAILAKNRQLASECAFSVESLESSLLKKSGVDKVKSLIFTLGFALCVAICVRQMWFEFYEIPSGSMRPTFKEQDRLAVSKTAFGINIPLTPREFYFDPDLVKRNGIVIFTGEDMDIRDVNTLYFYFFPGKKQYVKRLIGKPGDLLYFYGGEIFGIDKAGNDITQELQLASLSHIDHIPFIDFERKVVLPPHPIKGVYTPVFLYQMNEPVAKLSVSAGQKVSGEMLSLKGIHDPQSASVKQYGQLWGFDNFATARLLTKEQAGPLAAQVPATYAPLLYLELKHHPSISHGTLIQDEKGRVRPTIGLDTSIVPLSEGDLRTLFRNLYTARFIVESGKAYRYGSSAKNTHFLPTLAGVPDGCYEFIDGKAYQVLWQGITKELSESHPLCTFSLDRMQLLFNLGMEWDTRFSPEETRYHLAPARYAYYRNGDLFVMGKSLLPKESKTLQAFVERETNKGHLLASYQPFVDRGAPFTSNGQLDIDLIKQAGLMIPEKQYLVLGDNHAMSADSREFGFVPQENLRGSPDFIFWPPGDRFGHPNQPWYPFFNLPRTIVWIVAALGIGYSVIYWRRRNALPLNLSD